MGSLRQFIFRNVSASWALIALALAMKLLVPAGFMPEVSSHGIEIVLCSGTGPKTVIMDMPGMDMPGMAGDHKGGHDAPAKPDAPCAFAGLNAPSLGGVDVIQLAIAIAIILAAGLVHATILRMPQRAYLRPPLRGPPAHG